MNNKSVSELETVCAICLVPLEQSDYSTLVCKHVFHTSCIECWYEKDIRCPICRQDPLKLKRQEEYKKRYKPREERTGRRYKRNHRKESIGVGADYD